MNAVTICSRLGEQVCKQIISDLQPATVKRMLGQAHLPVVRSAQALSLKKRNEQWAQRLYEALGREQMATGVLYAWLGNCRNQMLSDFLDQLGVAHQHGLTDENFFEEMPAEKLVAAAQSLLEKHDKREVAIYLLFLEDANRLQKFDALKLDQYL